MQVFLTICTIQFISLPGLQYVYDLLNHTFHNYSNTLSYKFGYIYPLLWISTIITNCTCQL